MTPIAIGIFVFACAFGGSLVGIKLQAMLPEHHLSDKSRGTVTVAIGLIATMTALILGLVTSSAKSTFDAMETVVKHSAVDVLSLDRLLARYGPETATIRKGLMRMVENRIDMTWPRDQSRQPQLDPLNAGREGELFVAQIRALLPRTEEQRWLQSRALDLGESLLASRWAHVAALGTSIPLVFFSILLFWITITFASFGLFAPPNAMVVSALFMCALSVAGAVFLILEMDQPFAGLIRVSPEPLKYALSHLNQ